jgi:hypothetical protein
MRIIQGLPADAKGLILEHFGRSVARIQLDTKIDIWGIFDSSSFHPVENRDWALAAFLVNDKYRQPLIRKARAGDDDAMFLQLPYGLILHSIRGILDFELRGDKRIMLYCQSLWYYLADGDNNKIPERFKKKNGA